MADLTNLNGTPEDNIIVDNLMFATLFGSSYTYGGKTGFLYSANGDISDKDNIDSADRQFWETDVANDSIVSLYTTINIGALYHDRSLTAGLYYETGATDTFGFDGGQAIVRSLNAVAAYTVAKDQIPGAGGSPSRPTYPSLRLGYTDDITNGTTLASVDFHISGSQVPAFLSGRNFGINILGFRYFTSGPDIDVTAEIRTAYSDIAETFSGTLTGSLSAYADVNLTPASDFGNVGFSPLQPSYVVRCDFNYGGTIGSGDPFELDLYNIRASMDFGL